MGFVDSRYLFQLACNKSKQNRTQLAENVTDFFLNSGDSLSERERALMYDILHRVISDVEFPLRRTLSNRLSVMEGAPGELVRLLANDHIDIAFPLLFKSQALRDSDLMEIIRQRSQEHQLSIALRHSISEQVSDSLVETGNENVIRTLLENPSADVSQGTMKYLAEQSKRVDSFQEPILQRSDLDPAIAKKMYLWVSAALRRHIVDNFDFDQNILDDLLEQTASDKINLDVAAENDTQELAHILEDAELETPDMLLAALREGEIQLFLAMFARLTGLRRKLIMRLIFESGGEGLAIACKSIGIGKVTFSSIYTLCRKSQPKSVVSMKRESGRLMALYDQMTKEAACDVVHKWRHSSDYLSAIRELELGAPTHA